MINILFPRGQTGSPCAVLAGALALVVSLPAQQPTGTLELKNFRDAAGLAWADAVLPLAKGRYHKAPSLETEHGLACQVRPMGARWPDGSLRYLKLDVPVQVSKQQRLSLKLRPRTAALPGFRWHPAIVRGFQQVGLRIWIAGQVVGLGKFQMLDDGPLVKVIRARGRARNSSMYAELTLIAGHDASHLRYHLVWGNSDPTNQDLSEDPGWVVFEASGVDVSVENDAKVLEQAALSQGGRRFTLHRGGPVGDGQAQHLEGLLMFEGDAPRVRGLAHGWADSRAYGPFGELIPELKIKQKTWDDILRHDQLVLKKHPWAPAVHGCNPEPHNTGGQSDFGVVVMREDILRVDPARLEWIAHSVYQEWLRPTHYREADLSPVTIQNHPKLITRSGRPDFRSGAWVDTLGKPSNQYQLASHLAPDHLGRPWRGHDAEHWSINYLCAMAMLTGDRMAMQECGHQAELWLSRFTYNSGTYNDNAGPARGAGRALLAGCWLQLLTGRKDLEQRLHRRVGALKHALLKPRSGEPAKLPGVLAPRWRSNLGWFWPPWEEAIAAVGAAAVHALTGDVEAAQIAQTLADNVVLHGVGWTKHGFRCGYQLPFELSNSQPYHALADPNFESVHASGPGLTIWTLAAVTLASQYSAHQVARPLAQTILVDLLTDPVFRSEGDFARWVAVIPRHL